MGLRQELFKELIVSRTAWPSQRLFICVLSVTIKVNHICCLKERYHKLFF